MKTALTVWARITLSLGLVASASHALACNSRAYSDKEKLEVLQCEQDRDANYAAMREQERNSDPAYISARDAARHERDLEEERVRMQEEAALVKPDMSLIRLSVGKCNDFVWKNREIAGPVTLAITAATVFAGAATTAHEEPTAPGVAIGWTIAGLVTSVGDGFVINHEVQSALNMTDFPKLALELGTDNEGLVTSAYLASCNSQVENGCRLSLADLKKAAKTGHMCELWGSAPNQKN